MFSRILPRVSLALACAALGACTEERCANVRCAEGLVCDTFTGQCRPKVCLLDSQCTSPAAPLCDPELHVCVQCIHHQNCSRGQRCKKIEGAGVCEEATCRVEADCAGLPGREHCHPDQQRCVPCLTDGHCPSPQTCQAAAGGGTVCASPAKCLSDDDCPTAAKPHCDLTSYTCEECVVDEHCPAQKNARVCHPDTHACSDGPCDEDRDCLGAEDGEHCNASFGQPGRCVECTTNAHCDFDPGRTKCHPQAFVCLACVRDSDCDQSKGYGCDATTFECVYKGCRDDSMCFGGTRCQIAPGAAYGRCVRCLDGSGCTLGGVCQAATGTCVNRSACESDTDCAYPSFCGEGGTCVECTLDPHCSTGACNESGYCVEPEACESDSDCWVGRVCQAGACAAPDACSDDGFELNDTPYTAAGVETAPLSGTLCRHNDDWFSFAATAGDTVQIELRYDRTLGHLTMELVRQTVAGPRVVARSTPSAFGARVDLDALPSGIGPLYVGIKGATERTPYRLYPSITSSGGCADDRYELAPAVDPCPFGRTNDDLNCPTAIGSAAPGAVSCPNDDDWYRLSAPANKRVVVRAENDALPYDLYLILYYLDGTTLRFEDVDDFPDVASSTARAAPTDYWVRVMNFLGEPIRYDLSAQFFDPQPSNDSCEPPLAATPLVPGQWTAGTLQGAVDDFAPACGAAGAPDVVYRLDLSAPKRVRVEADAGFNLGLAAIRHWCRFTAPSDYVGCSDAEGTSESLDLVLSTANGNSDYYFVVQPKNPQATGPFQIRVLVSDPPPIPEGDACTAASILVDGSTAEGDLALARDDGRPTCGPSGRGDAFYTFTLERPQSVRLALAAGYDGAALGLRAGGCGGTEIACRAGGRALEILDPALDAGTYTVVVDGGGATGGAYALSFQVGEPMHPPPNDACEGAAPLSDAATAEGTTLLAAHDFAPSCVAANSRGRDAVWRFTVPDGGDGAPLRARLSLDAAFDAVLAVYAACPAAELACSEGPPRVDLLALPPGDYYAVVDGYSEGAAGPYALTLVLEPAPPVPANDVCAAAPPLFFEGGHAATEGTTLRAEDDDGPAGCTGGPLLGPDVAWTVTLAPGETVEATVVPEGFDAAIYLLAACGAQACLAGADRSFLAGGEETLSWTYPTEASGPATFVLVVDSYDEGQRGAFSLRATLSGP